MFKLIDTHAHLDQIDNIESALNRAKDFGVKAIIAVGVDCDSGVKILDIAKTNQVPKIFIALGIHPSEIKDDELNSTSRLIEENIKNIIAIGEIGLDYWYKPVKKDKSKKEEQREVFKQQLQLAKKHNLPVIIHSRGAWEDCLNSCLDAQIEQAVFHWYSGPVDILKKIIQNNYFISATPSLAYSPQHQEAIKETPLEKLLLETDSPVFFGKVESGGFRAEPKDVLRTLELVSKLKNIPQKKIVEKTTETTERLFNIRI